MDPAERIGTPTEEGKRRWPPEGFYTEYARTCKPDCQDPCKGECGCEACHWAYGDFLSSE